MRQQFFHLRDSVMHYIRMNANHLVMFTLYRTCKFFYKMDRFCIVKKIFFESNNIIVFQITDKLTTYVPLKKLKMLGNFWITDLINFRCCYPKEILQQIYRCDGDLTFWSLCVIYNKTSDHRPFYLSDYKALINRGSPKACNAWDPLLADDGRIVSLQELMSAFPNVSNIEYGFYKS